MKHLALILFVQVTVHAAVEPRILRNVVSETARDSRLEKLMRELVGGPDVPIERYYYNRVDLNNDRTPELIVMAVGQYICGSAGCPTFVLRKTSSGYAVVTDLELSKAPILVSANRTNGWNDLVMFYRGYGGDAGQYGVLEFNGTSYVPRNSNSAQSTPETVAYLAGLPNGGVRLRQ